MFHQLLLCALFGLALAASTGTNGQGSQTQAESGSPAVNNNLINTNDPTKKNEAPGYHYGVPGYYGGGYGGGYGAGYGYGGPSYGYGGFQQGFPGFGGDGGVVIEGGVCTLNAHYWLSLNGEKRHCRDTATIDWDNCRTCCRFAARRGGHHMGGHHFDVFQVNGFLATEGGNEPERGLSFTKKECVCCVPKEYVHHYDWFGSGSSSSGGGGGGGVFAGGEPNWQQRQSPVASSPFSNYQK